MKWIKASESTPELHPVNNSEENHFRLDGHKVDGFFLHSQCFEYFDKGIEGYRQLELPEFNRIEWLDESPTTPLSNEQVEEAASKWADEYYQKGSDEVLSTYTHNDLWLNRYHNYLSGFNAALHHLPIPAEGEKWQGIDNPPQIEERVLVKMECIGDTYVCIAKYIGNGDFKKDKGTLTRPMEIITGWMKLPDL